MDCNRLLEQIAETRKRLFAEGHLNENFNILENFEKRCDLEFFVEGALDSYFMMSAEVLAKVEQELEKVPLNFVMLIKLLNGIREYSSSVGANMVLIRVNQLRQHVENRNNTQSCKDALRELKLEREIFKSRMELYFRIMVWDPPSEIDDDPGFEDEESTDEE